MLPTLGPTNAFYGNIDEQARGSEHLHMLVWMSGYSAPSQIQQAMQDEHWKDAFCAYIDNIIHAVLHDDWSAATAPPAAGGDEYIPTRNTLSFAEEPKHPVPGSVAAVCQAIPIDPNSADYPRQLLQRMETLPGP